MEKFTVVSKIAKDYLGGELQKLFVEYENPTFVHVQIIYEDDSDFQLDYQLDIDLKKEKTLFRKHVLTNPFEATNLHRNKDFEHALYDYLMHHKRA